MSAITGSSVGARESAPVAQTEGRRLATETKASFKTTEFIAYIAVLIGLLVAGAITKASHYGGNHDPLRADRVWLYVIILTVGYMLSRGLAKSGSRERYQADRD